MVSDKLFNFTSILLFEKAPDLLDSGRVEVESAVSANFTAHIWDTYSIGNIYNSLCGKSDTQQIFAYSNQPTGSRNKIMQQVEEVGVYILENISNNRKIPHVFALNNLDWKKKKTTLQGGSFNATTAIIIENPDSSDNDQHAKAIRISTSTPEQRKTLPSGPSTSIPTIRISAKDRQITRSLGNIMAVDSLHTQADRTSEYMLLVYRSGSAATTSQLLDIPCETSVQDFIHTTKPAKCDTSLSSQHP